MSSEKLPSVAQRYLEYFASGSNHTARAKRLDIDAFLKFLAQHRNKKLDQLTPKDWDFSATQRFIERALERGQAPATVARRIATLKHMGRTLAEQLPGFVNPTRDVRSPRVAPLRPKALTDNEMKKVRARAERRTHEKDNFIRKRNRTLVNFLLDTGIRADEIRLLKRAQIDDGLEWIENVRTKGRKYRNVYITSAMRVELRDYLEAREHELKRFFPRISVAQSKALPLFISSYRVNPEEPESFRMGAKTIWRAVHEVSVDTELHPHLLRHSYAVDLLESSGDVRLVAQALGHSDVRITMRYTERRDEEVARALERARKRQD